LYGYTISHRDYNTLTGTVLVNDHDVSLTLPLNPSQNVPTQRHTATVTVTDKDSGDIISDATVRVDGVNALTNSLGQVQFNRLDDGVYDFLVSKTGFVAVQGNFTVAGSDINVLIELEELDEDDREFRQKARRGIFIDSIRIPDAYNVQPGDTVVIRLNFENQGDDEMKAIATAVITELGIRGSSGPFDLLDDSGRQTRILRLDIPESAQSGYYWVRITLGEGSKTRVVHREVFIR